MPLFQSVKTIAGYVATSAAEVLFSSKLAGEVLSRLYVNGDGSIATSGPADAVTAVTFASTTVTVTTSAAHGYAANDPVTIAGVVGLTNVNGAAVVLTRPSSTTFTFTAGTAPVGTYTSGGQVQRTWGTGSLGNEGIWSLIMNSATKVGLSIRGRQGATGAMFICVDYLNQPIFGVGQAGGAYVLGDNFRIFNGADIFNPVVHLRQDGTVRLAKGDAAGGAGVLAIGQVTTPPTGKPDGTHTIDGSTTAPGAALWADSAGRLFVKRSNGLTDSLGGSRPVGSANVATVGDWLTPPAATQGTYAMSAADTNRMFLMPIDVTDTSAVFNAVGALCSVAGVGGTYQQFRLGIYQDDGSLNRPSLTMQIADLGVASNGYTSLTTTTNVTTLTTTYSFPTAGRFWIGAWFQNAGTITSYPTLVTAQSGMLASGADLSSTGRGWYVSGVTGALPTTGTLVSTLAVPYVGLKRSA